MDRKEAGVIEELLELQDPEVQKENQGFQEWKAWMDETAFLENQVLMVFMGVMVLMVYQG